MYPTHPKFLPWALADATRERYSSLTIDCSPSSDEQTRVRKTAFPGDDVCVYLPPK